MFDLTTTVFDLEVIKYWAMRQDTPAIHYLRWLGYQELKHSGIDPAITEAVRRTVDLKSVRPLLAVMYAHQIYIGSGKTYAKDTGCFLRAATRYNYADISSVRKAAARYAPGLFKQ